MGLEHFGLELLDSLRACTQRMNAALLYLLEREVQSAALPDIHLRGTVGSINGLVKKLGPGQCTHDSHTESSHVSEGMLSYPLAAVFLDYHDNSGDRVATREDLNRVVARVLKRILRNADFLRLSPQVIGTLGADPTEVKFRPHNLVLKNVQDCAMVRLVLIEPTGSTRTVGIRLLVDLDNALLHRARCACSLGGRAYLGTCPASDGTSSGREKTMNPLQQKLNELLTTVSAEASKGEEDFFKGIEGSLNSLCKAIAHEAGADSAAVFFVTDDNPSGSQPHMVMRGASGRLQETFTEHLEDWRKWRRGGKKSKDGYSGFAYPSAITDEFCALNAEGRQQAIRGWSVTNQVWHLAKGRLANSNRAMDELHGGAARAGRGDSIAYRGDELHTTFRTMVAVPIFSQGQDDQIMTFQDSQRNDLYPQGASSSGEFLHRYRVMGILKVENKIPEHGDVTIEAIEKELRQQVSRGLEVTPSEWQDILDWCGGIVRTNALLLSATVVSFPKCCAAQR